MRPGTHDLELYRGDTYQWRFVLWADDAQTVPIDLTGATALCEIRDKSAGTQIVELDTTIEAPNVIAVEMNPTHWTSCPYSGVWDVQVTFADATVRTMLTGKVRTITDVVDSLPVATLARR